MTSDFKTLLDQEYTWPCEYTFKFVVKKELTAELKALLPCPNITERPSKTGKYISVTAVAVVESSDGVIAIYEKCSTVKGIISL